MNAQWLTIIYLMLMSKMSTSSFVSIRSEVYQYLSYYGYIAPNMQNGTYGVLVDLDDWNKAIMKFQNFAGLEDTGLFDQATKDAMALPRCNVKDNIGYGLHSRSKRYTIHGTKVVARILTYRVVKYPENSKFRHDIIDTELRRAFSLWSNQIELTFTHIQSGKANIEIRFEKGEHGDGIPFGGVRNGFAHAFFPAALNEIHFNSDENWTYNSEDGINFFQAAVHEIGHTLGLSHSDVSSSAMFPFYKEYNPNFKLDEDDIAGIQRLYKRYTVKVKPGYESMDLCLYPRPDAIFHNVDGDTIFFKGTHYYKLTDQRSIEVGYPKFIPDTWVGLPVIIDAAFTLKNSTYFFKGAYYWKFDGTIMAPSYPKYIEDGWVGIPNNLDAAFVWSGNGKIYFFKGDKFWRFDPDKKPAVRSVYPKNISNWNGVPNYIDAAFQKYGFTYFFKNDVYYRFNDRTFAVDDDPIAYPRSTGYWWLGCHTSPNGTIEYMNGLLYS